MVQLVKASSGLLGERGPKMSYREPELQQEDLGTLAAAGLLTVSPGMNAREKPCTLAAYGLSLPPDLYGE